MERFVPDWLAWLIVRWQYRRFEHVKVTGPMAKFIGTPLKFQHPQTKVSYRTIAARHLDGDTVLVIGERLGHA